MPDPNPAPSIEERVYEPSYEYDRYSKVIDLNDGTVYFPWKHALLYNLDQRYRHRCTRRLADLFTSSYCLAILQCMRDVVYCGWDMARIGICTARGTLGHESWEVDSCAYDGY